MSAPDRFDTREAVLRDALEEAKLLAAEALDLEARSDRPSSAAMRAFSRIEFVILTALAT